MEMVAILQRAKLLQCLSTRASSSEVRRAARLAEAASGRTLGMGLRTRRAGVGFVEAKIIASLSARSRATGQVWGEDVVGTQMPPTKQLLNKLQLGKVMKYPLQVQQQMQPLPIRALKVQVWVRRATPKGLLVLQPRRCKRGELQLPIL